MSNIELKGDIKIDPPMLASLVRGGDDLAEAIKITDFIFMVRDISNAYLVTTNEGDVMINTGFMDNVDRNQSLLLPVRNAALRYIVLTQAHADHFGGVPAFHESSTIVVAGKKFTETCQYFRDLGPYLQRRTAKLWASTLKRASNPMPPPIIVPDIEVEDSFAFELGEQRFEIFSTPGGETLDSICVWMPKEKIVFTGNLFGPVFLAIPNLVTIRGDRPRLVVSYLDSLERVRALDAELLITGHGDPISGADNIRTSLDKLHAAVTYIRDAVVEGMNEGKTVHDLMRDIVLPDLLSIGEFHGKVAWAVRSIWEEYSGWFHYEDSTPGLYAVPRSSINADLVELAGGVDAIAARAIQKVVEQKPLEALHLIDIALYADCAHADALAAKREALSALLRQSGGSNLSETMWLKSEIAVVDDRLRSTGA